MKNRFLLMLLGAFLWLPAFSQTNAKIEELKSKRGELQAQIKQSESLLLSTKSDVKSQLSDLALINGQLEERRKFIAAIEKDMASLDGEILLLERQIKRLNMELDEKRKKYAESVRYLHKNRSIEDKLLFIFSANTFSQTYRRLRYVTEYATFQRVQGEQIKEKSAQVEAKRSELLVVKDEKAVLLAQREEERLKMEEQRRQQRAIVDKLQKKQRNLQAELNKQRKESQRLNAQIDKLIEQEIAAAKRRAEEAERKRLEAAAKKGETTKSNGNASSKDAEKNVAMMEVYEGDRKLSSVFEQNQGKLPMPITDPYVIVSHFGQYAVEGLKNVKLDNKGIDIKGQKGASARSIFDGEVSAVFQFGGTTGVLVRHGSYISVYCNLASSSVKRGQKIKTHDIIGPIAVDQSGNTILHFQLRKETSKLNPERWLGK